MQKRRLSVSQRSVLFNQVNPFEGSDGFTSLLSRRAQISQLQTNVQQYKHFGEQTKNILTSSDYSTFAKKGQANDDMLLNKEN